MGNTFERCRMEPKDGGLGTYTDPQGRLFEGVDVYVGLTIIATVGQSDIPDPDLTPSSEWEYCREAHAHGWETCNLRALFMARQKDAQGVDIPGTSRKDKLVAWMQARRAEKVRDLPKEIPLPTRKVTRDGKEVDEPIRGVSLT